MSGTVLYLDDASVSYTETQGDEGDCELFISDILVGTHTLRVERAGFASNSLSVLINSYQETTVGTALRVNRAVGSLSGVVLLQGRTRHAGTQITLSGQDEIGDQGGKVYTAFSLDDGSFNADQLWVGAYEVYAQQEGFVRARLGQFTVNPDQNTEASTQESPFTLIKQVGDFLINEGAQFTDDSSVLLSLNLTILLLSEREYRVKSLRQILAPKIVTVEHKDSALRANVGSVGMTQIVMELCWLVIKPALAEE